MSRRSWAWGAGLTLLGIIVLAAGAHAMATYRAPAGSTQATTLGQVGGVVIGAVVTIAGCTVLATGCRRRLELRRRRRLRDRLAAHGG